MVPKSTIFRHRLLKKKYIFDSMRAQRRLAHCLYSSLQEAQRSFAHHPRQLYHDGVELECSKSSPTTSACHMMCCLVMTSSRHTAHGTRYTAYGIRHTTHGIRHTVYGIRNTAYGIRRSHLATRGHSVGSHTSLSRCIKME